MSFNNLYLLKATVKSNIYLPGSSKSNEKTRDMTIGLAVVGGLLFAVVAAGIVSCVYIRKAAPATPKGPDTRKAPENNKNNRGFDASLDSDPSSLTVI